MFVISFLTSVLAVMPAVFHHILAPSDARWCSERQAEPGRGGRALSAVAANHKRLAETNKPGGGGFRRLRGMTTILRKYHSVARCTLLGEMIEDTAHRYYYRLRFSSDELTFVEKSPAIHLTPCPACRTGPPANNAAAPSGRTHDDIDPRRRWPGSGSANRLVARRLVGRPDLIERRMA